MLLRSGNNRYKFSILGFPVRSRRCVTQRNFPKYSPSEYARHHSPSGPMNFITDDKSIPVHITPVAVAEEMSRLDPHYIPSKTPGKLVEFR
mgnify:CR=1 FL=1